MASLAYEKQINYIKVLANKNNYFIIANLEELPKYRAAALISFMSKNEGEYDEFRDIIRIKGPKIPNLVGEYLFEDR
jgi:hypothetical protein